MEIKSRFFDAVKKNILPIPASVSEQKAWLFARCCWIYYFNCSAAWMAIWCGS